MLCLAAQSCPTLCNAMDCSTPGSSVHGDSPGKNTGVGCHILLQEIFPTHGSNPGLLHFRQILYRLSHQGSPRILRWVDYPFSRGIYQPRNQTRASCIVGGFLTNWATREAPLHVLPDLKTNPGYHSNMMLLRQVLGPDALGRPRGIGWRGRWEGGSGWGIHVYPWLIHVNVWQKPLQYCKVISLQLIKK